MLLTTALLRAAGAQPVRPAAGTQNLELGGITLGIKTARARIPEVLDLFPRLLKEAVPPSSSLSGGEQK